VIAVHEFSRDKKMKKKKRHIPLFYDSEYLLIKYFCSEKKIKPGLSSKAWKETNNDHQGSKLVHSPVGLACCCDIWDKYITLKWER